MAWAAFKSLRTINQLADDAKGEVNTMDGTKPGWKTTEFWGARLTQIAALLAMVLGFKYNVPPDFQEMIVKLGMGVIGAVETGYAISRGLAKKS